MIKAPLKQDIKLKIIIEYLKSGGISRMKAKTLLIALFTIIVEQ